jgi:hypothetical protein
MTDDGGGPAGRPGVPEAEPFEAEPLDDPESEPGALTVRLVSRVAHATLAGIALMFCWFAMNAVLDDVLGCAAADCAAQASRVAWWTGLATVILAWPLLRLAGLRPALPIALVAPALLIVPVVLLGAGAGSRNPYLMYAVVASIPAAYGVAALVTAPMLARRLRLGLAATILALIVASLLAANL